MIPSVVCNPLSPSIESFLILYLYYIKTGSQCQVFYALICAISALGHIIKFSSSRNAARISLCRSFTRCRAASSLFSLLLRDGFLKYLRSLSSLYIPSLITRFFSFCIARFGSSPRLIFIVIVMLFSCYSVLQSCVIKLYTSSISHCQAFVKWPGSSPDGSRDYPRSTQRMRCRIVLWGAVAVAFWRGFGVGVIPPWFPPLRNG